MTIRKFFYVSTQNLFPFVLLFFFNEYENDVKLFSPIYQCCHCYLNSSSIIINFLIGELQEKHAPLVIVATQSSDYKYCLWDKVVSLLDTVRKMSPAVFQTFEETWLRSWTLKPSRISQVAWGWLCIQSEIRVSFLD